MHVGPEDLGIFYTMVSIFFIVSTFTLGFAYYALKNDHNHDETEPHTHH
jgi:O-antigen/teichoic acid export membrane protein